MKRILVASILIIALISACNGNSNSNGDSAAIENVIRDYFNYYNEGDYAKCLTYCTNYEDADEEIAELAGLKDSIGDVTLESIENINISGSTATASITRMVAGQIYTNAINMVKKDGNWKIDIGLQAMLVTEIYVIDADGSNFTRLTTNTIEEILPRWSPDGTKIAFASETAIYVMNADGSNMATLDNGSLPTWSPDGAKIAYMSSGSGNRDICVINADGTGKITLTNDNESKSELSWSPDSNKVSYSSYNQESYRQDIYVVNADGTGRVNLTNSTSREQTHAWSPDGSKIAYGALQWVTQQGVINQDIYIMNADGTGKVLVSSGAHIMPQFTWSPDSTRLAFFSNREGMGIYGDVYVVNADGSGLNRLTNLTGWIGGLQWSPDGDKIAFQCIINPDPEQEPTEMFKVYVVNADDSELAILTDEVYGSPRWSPDGSKIACIGGHRYNEIYMNAIYVMNSDGSDITKLVDTARYDLTMQWSPDGSRLLFTADR